MEIARLPINSNSQFLAVREALEACLTGIVEGPEVAFDMAFFLAELPVMQYYVQARRLNAKGDISIEAQRVADSEPVLLTTQDTTAKLLGWDVPLVDSDCPNYSQAVNLEESGARRVANELVDALCHLGRVQPDAWFTIGPMSLRDKMGVSGLFWTMEGDNQYLCQKGHNVMGTVEGRAQAKSR